jgi:hypothetical protein
MTFIKAYRRWIGLAAGVAASLLLYLAGGVWQAMLPANAVAGWLLAAFGILFFAAVIVFAFGEIVPMPKRVVQVQAAAPKEAPPPPVINYRAESDGTVMLFEGEATPESAVDATVMIGGAAEAVRQPDFSFRWTEGGKPCMVSRGTFPITIGRDAKCDVAINDPSVSRRHAQLTFEAGAYDLEDLASSNGTFIGGERVRGKARLPIGQSVAFGKIEVQIEMVR